MARNLGRGGETLRRTTLAALSEDEADMLTVIVVGATTTPSGLRRRLGLHPARLLVAAVTVHFIGAGPGAADLITVRGRDIVARCPVCLYAGSLVPPAVVAAAPAGARVIDTAPLTLDRIVDEMRRADAEGKDVARVHSGDPSLYGATAEQMRRLDALGIAWDVIPGVPAFAARGRGAGLRADAAGSGAKRRADADGGQGVGDAAGRGPCRLRHDRRDARAAPLIRNLRAVERALVPICGADCPVAVVHRASWPDQMIVRGTLGDIRARVRAARITRTALIFIGRALAPEGFAESALYDPAHAHLLRPRRGDARMPAQIRACLARGGKVRRQGEAARPAPGAGRDGPRETAETRGMRYGCQGRLAVRLRPDLLGLLHLLGNQGAITARTASDYFIAGRGISIWVFVLAATATSFSGWTFMGHPGLIYRDGLPYATPRSTPSPYPSPASCSSNASG